MRYLSEETMQRIIAFVDEYYNENSYSPTIAEISRSLSLAVGTVHKYLHRMTEMDKLYFDGRHIITPYIEELQGKFHAPVSGDIACGSPIYVEEQYDDSFPIPTDFIGKGEYFWLRAKGDSMTNAGIDSGDLVLIRKQNTANDNELVYPSAGFFFRNFFLVNPIKVVLVVCPQHSIVSEVPSCKLVSQVQEGKILSFIAAPSWNRGCMQMMFLRYLISRR